jgi:hypothetical protein
MFKCKVCDKTYSRPDSLSRHYNTVHSQNGGDSIEENESVIDEDQYSDNDTGSYNSDSEEEPLTDETVSHLETTIINAEEGLIKLTKNHILKIVNKKEFKDDGSDNEEPNAYEGDDVIDEDGLILLRRIMSAHLADTYNLTKSGLENILDNLMINNEEAED